MRIDAKADDGIIEAISNEGNDQWILGLQFHPEQLIRKNDEFKVLFIDFVKQANLFTRIPVAIITGEGTDENIKRAYTYPIVDMLQKPFNEVSVKSVVEKTMARKK